MKKQFYTIFTITVAALLVGSIAYAAKKKLRTKSEPLAADISEAELAVDLLDVNGDPKHKSPKVGDTNKRGDGVLKDLATAKKPQK